MADIQETYAPFAFPTGKKSIIKVIGVGGGGGNAVNHMYKEGIHDVSFVVCNTDSKALNDSPVPVKLQLGQEGLGAGNKPEKARQVTEESIEDIKRMLDDGTKMVFITAGMGGGTGTGASPIIAKTAKEMDILTVGIVTIPFLWEGRTKIDQALDGVDEISKNVDALLVVNNERLRNIYNDKTLSEAFARADDTLCKAARSISEIITMHGHINLDFQDVKTILKDGGVAIMSNGYGQGEGRVSKAIEDALHSPLLNDNDIYNSKKVLIHIIEPGPEGTQPLMMEEMNDINEFMERMQNSAVETKWGHSYDPSLNDQIKITILASGFGIQDIHADQMDEHLQKRSEEERRRAAERAEEEAANEERRGKYYGPDKNGHVRKPIYSFIFNEDELDNDDIISGVETSPTYKRYKTTLASLRPHVTEPADTTPKAGQTISFG